MTAFKTVLETFSLPIYYCLLFMTCRNTTFELESIFSSYFIPKDNEEILVSRETFLDYRPLKTRIKSTKLINMLYDAIDQIYQRFIRTMRLHSVFFFSSTHRMERPSLNICSEDTRSLQTLTKSYILKKQVAVVFIKRYSNCSFFSHSHTTVSFVFICL